jgi:hypothetical protein
MPLKLYSIWVECEAYSSGVMLIPPLAGLEILQHIHQGTYFVAPSVNPAFGGTHALTLNKISHFWMDTAIAQPALSKA